MWLSIALLISVFQFCGASIVDYKASITSGPLGYSDKSSACNTIDRRNMQMWRHENLPNSSTICPFNPNSYMTCPFGGEECLNNNWTCLLPPWKVCDGFSQCLEDECNCGGTKVLYCKDGGGCVSLEQVCNSVPDCPDGEDEFLCEGAVVTQCQNFMSVTVNDR